MAWASLVFAGSSALSSIALALVLGGLLLWGLFGSMVKTGVGAAELTSTCNPGEAGDAPVTLPATLPLRLAGLPGTGDETAEMSRSIAAI